jgi:hypothetical protein
MPKCQYHKTKFDAKYFNQKFCLSDDECIKAFNESVKLQKEKQKAKQWQKEKKEIKEKLMTKSDFEKLLQKEINTIIRLIDKDFKCISSGKPLNDKFDAGHFYSVGSNATLRFNLLNIYAQSVYANQYLSGDQINFINGIEENYGIGLKDYVLRLKSEYPILKLTTDELKEKITIARSIVKHLKLENKTYNSIQRIDLRRQFNKMIGIYN